MTRTCDPPPTDSVLMEQVQAGGRTALGELYDRLALRAYRTAFSVCHDRESAQDAVQDAFLSIWHSSSTYHASQGPVVNWAMSIVRHRAIYLARRGAVLAAHNDGPARLEEQAAKDDLPADFAIHADTEKLEELLKVLPARQQEVIRLGFFEGLTHQEIALRLALPAGTVKGRMRLGLSKLRSEFEP